MTISVVRVLVPGVFALPQLRKTILPWLAKAGYPNPEPTYDFIASQAGVSGTQILLGFEDDVLRGGGVTLLPGSPLMVAPQVVFAYNEGSRELGKALQAEAVAFIRAAGYSKFLYVNRTDNPDEVHFRAWRDVTKNARHYGSMIEMEVV